MARPSLILPAMSLVLTALAGPMTFSADVKVLDPMPVMILTGYSEAQQFRSPNCVFVDRKRGDIWVADTGNHQIVGFDSTGLPIISFRHMNVDPETGEATPGSPVSLVVDSTGEIFVTDGSSFQIFEYDYRGRLVKKINPARILGQDKARVGWLHVDGSDNLYFIEVDSFQLVVLNQNRDLLRKISLKRFTKPGSNPNDAEQKMFVESLCSLDIGADGKLYMVNPDDYPCVRVLDSTGKELLAFGDICEGRENFDRPVSIVSIDDGTFWVADGDTGAVKQFATDGSFQQYIGGPGSRPGEMRYPISLATDGKNKLYVAEKVTNRVQVFALK